MSGLNSKIIIKMFVISVAVASVRVRQSELYVTTK
jgi:hypothetical protein